MKYKSTDLTSHYSFTTFCSFYSWEQRGGGFVPSVLVEKAICLRIHKETHLANCDENCRGHERQSRHAIPYLSSRWAQRLRAYQYLYLRDIYLFLIQLGLTLFSLHQEICRYDSSLIFLYVHSTLCAHVEIRRQPCMLSPRCQIFVFACLHFGVLFVDSILLGLELTIWAGWRLNPRVAPISTFLVL